MPRRAKGPRLWLRPAQYDGGKLTHAAAWLILDGTSQRRTGFGIDATQKQKEQALKDYLVSKHSERANVGSRDPSQILIADVLAKYTRDVAHKHARPDETAARIGFLKSFWLPHTLDYVTGDTCRRYISKRSTESAARRELEDLRAAINHHRREGLHDRIISVVLPDKSASREAWLTRQQAAALIRAAWRYREQQNFRGTDRRTRRHVARFMVVARYMGSRASVICSASIEPIRPAGKAWVDLRNGIFYGRPIGHRETKKRRQTVRVPPPLLAHMRRWRRKGQKYVVEWNGEPVARITKAHNACVVAAGLGPEITPHIWRHSVATWLMQAGADPYKASAFLAMSLETLLRVYGHHHPDDSASVHGALRGPRLRQWNGNDMREQKRSGGPNNVAEMAAESLIA